MEIQFPPGVVKSDSLASSVGRYVEANHIRWVGGHPEKIGGWKRLFPENLQGIPRSSHVYRAPSGLEVIAFGTEDRLYALDAGDPSGFPPADSGHRGPINITPFRLVDATVGPDPFRTSIIGDTSSGHFNDPTVVKVHHPNHGAVTHDTVWISSVTNPVGGLTISGAYFVRNIIIVEVIDGVTTNAVDIDNYYLVRSDIHATSNDVGGGTVTLKYETNTGVTGGFEGTGYGGGPYGSDLYGKERNMTGHQITPRYWSLDNYGTRLLAAYQGGTIYWWDQDVDQRAVAIITDHDTALPLPSGPRTPVPTDVIYAFVTEERFIFALREDMNVSWPDQDNPTNWTPGLTSKANTRRLAKGNRLIAGGALGGGVSLVWTDTSLYAFQFTGGQFVYSSRMAGSNCGLLGPGAFCIAEGAAFWAGTNGFHIFNGSVQGIPNADDIHAWFYGNMTPGNRRKTTCWYNAADREVWFTAALGGDPETPKNPDDPDDPPAADGAIEPTHYVFVNIDSWYWGAGVLPRTCASFSVVQGILLGATDGAIYRHEVGVDAEKVPGSPTSIPTLLRSGLYRISEAEKNLDIFGFSPDFETQLGNIDGRVFTQDRPMNSVHADTETFTLTPTTGMMDIRVRGRYIGFELSQDVVGGYWRMGIPVAEMQEAGARR